jgi:hypothetical protein
MTSVQTSFRSHPCKLPQMAGLVASMSLFVLIPAKAAFITALSPSLADVSAAIASAHEGDTVIVPAGTAHWTSTLDITKGITLQGATTTAGAGTTSATAADATIIVDDVPVVNDNAINVNVTLTPNQTFRLTGFTFRHGNRTFKPENAGCVRIGGTCPGSSGTGSVRADHCHFDQLYQSGIFVIGWIYGVMDHNLLDIRGDTGTISSMKIFNGQTWGGGANTNGDGSWAEPAYFGSEKFTFVETNTINEMGTIQTAGDIDIRYGARYVNRYNCFKNCTIVNGHGTESGGRIRGQRAIEYYKNIATTTYGQSLGLTRSGVAIYHGNTWTGPYTTVGLSQVIFREDFPYPMFGDVGANGTNPWDVNDTEGDGTNVPGHAPHLYASGMASSTGTVDGSDGTLIVSGAGWATNQFAGCIVTNTTQTVSQGTQHPCSRVKSNTSDTITYACNAPDGPPKTFNAGDQFVIYRVLIALDQIGRGKCDLLAQTPPINTVTGGTDWPHQALEPTYGWLNTMSGSTAGSVVKVGSDYPTVQEDRDYYNQNTSFNGTVGVGAGTLASRPATCTPGVAYWATDQGEWDSTHSGADGQLYQCTATNTWTLYYKPFLYPHPLVSGAPAAPRNLRVIAGP